MCYSPLIIYRFPGNNRTSSRAASDLPIQTMIDHSMDAYFLKNPLPRVLACAPSAAELRELREIPRKVCDERAVRSQTLLARQRGRKQRERRRQNSESKQESAISHLVTTNSRARAPPQDPSHRKPTRISMDRGTLVGELSRGVRST